MSGGSKKSVESLEEYRYSPKVFCSCIVHNTDTPRNAMRISCTAAVLVCSRCVTKKKISLIWELDPIKMFDLFETDKAGLLLAFKGFFSTQPKKYEGNYFSLNWIRLLARSS